MAREFAIAFYKSKEWAAVREYVLMRDRYLCQRCRKPAQEVHHIKHLTPENIWDPNIALNPNNLISLCREDHFKIHQQDKSEGKKKHDKGKHADCGDGFHFDENGMLVRD